MTYKIKQNVNSTRWIGVKLDIVSGYDDETDNPYVDIVFHGTDVGIMGYNGNTHLLGISKATRSDKLEILKKMARAYVDGYEYVMKEVA